MYQSRGSSKQSCRLIAVLCGKFADRQEVKCKRLYPFPELLSSGRIEVHTLFNPTPDSFRDAQKSLEPNILFFQGQQLENEEEIGNLVWEDLDVSEPEMFASLIAPPPTIVYLEVPNGEKIAQTLHSKGIPYVMYWKNEFSSYAASHFHQSLLSVVQSSCCHAWDAFQLAHASFRLYCESNNFVLHANDQHCNNKFEPHLLGDAPKINAIIPETVPEDGKDISLDALPVTKIYDDDVDVRFLICGAPCTSECLLNSFEDGLNALFNIEIRGSKLHNRIRIHDCQTRLIWIWIVRVGSARAYQISSDMLVMPSRATRKMKIRSKLTIISLKNEQFEKNLNESTIFLKRFLVLISTK